MNESLNNGSAEMLKKLFISSDDKLSVHALIISPKSSYKIAQSIVNENNDFDRTRQAGLAACQIIRESYTDQKIDLSERELKWLYTIENELDKYSTENTVLEYAQGRYSEKVHFEEYAL